MHHVHKPPRRARSLAAGLAGAALLALAAAPAAATDVGVSIGISQPGVYGRIDIGRFPQPQVVLAQPVVIVPQAVAVQPVYLHVPPGHRKNWKKHCRDYGACGVPVYFVRDDWYARHVHAGPAVHGHGHGHAHGHGKGHGKGKGRDD